MTYITDLQDARDNIAANIKAITASPKPSYSIDGQTVQWTAYLRMLIDKLKELNTQINAADPAEVHSVGITGWHH